MRAISRISRRISPPRDAASPMPRPTTCAAISARSPSAALRPHRWRGGSRPSASSIASSMRRAGAATIPSAIIEGPQARPPAAEGAQHRGRRPPVGHGARRHRQVRTAAARAAARGAARLPARGALRHRAARLRAGRAAGVGGRAQRAHAHGARQGRQGAAGAAQRGGEGRHARLSRPAGGDRPRPEIEMAVPLLRRERPSHPPAFRPRTQGAGGRGRAALRRR